MKLKLALPPTLMLMMSMSCLQVGIALSKTLFPILGSAGTACIRQGVAALLLLMFWRPRWATYQRQHYLAAALLGIEIGIATLAFFASISRIPVAISVTIGFIGPLGIALWDSQRLLDYLWVLLAGLGLVLLAPLGGSELDPVGLGLALFAGCCWATNILLNRRVGRLFAGGEGLAMALAVAALVMMPFGIRPGMGLFNGSVLLMVGLVALLGSAIPYSLEMEVLRRMPSRVFGVWMSLEPAIAAVAGFVLLKEQLGWRSILALILVVLAAAGSGYCKPPTLRQSATELKKLDP